jgi:SpoVK/Ycf46/Vps4 family AAA+-type ATPase
MKRPSNTARPTSAALVPSLRLPAKDVAQVRSVVASANTRANATHKVLLLSGRNAAAAAGAVAKELRSDILRVDLSEVVSKFIGETEKNLDRLFAEAEATDAVLIFDEADALFGKRTDVKDAHDRLAEIHFLLQSIGNHRGLVILVSKPRLTLPMTLQRRFSAYRFPPDRVS